MRQAIQVALLQFRLTLKSPGLIIAMFAMPVFFAFIFGVLTSGTTGTNEDGSIKAYPLALVVDDGSFAAQEMVDLLEQEPFLHLMPIEHSQINKFLSDKRAVAALIIPPGFGEALDQGNEPEIRLESLPGSNTELVVAPAIRRTAARFGGDYQLARKVSAGGTVGLEEAYRRIAADRLASGASVQRETASKKAAAADPGIVMGQVTMGFVVMFVMILVFMSGSAILKEREGGTWGRLLTTPASKLALLSGYLISFVLIGLFQFGVLVAATTWLFHFSWGPLLPLLAMGTVFILSTAGLGLFVSSVVRTSDQQRTIGTALIAVTSALGGVYWPLEYMPQAMQKVAYLTPQAWAMLGFREVMLRGGSWSELFWPLVVLLALTVIFMGAGLLRVRYE